jgi:FkbM family methyltransferase
MNLRTWIYIAGKLTQPVNLKGFFRFMGRVNNRFSLIAILAFNAPTRVRIRFKGHRFTFEDVTLENLSSLYEVFGKEVYRMDVSAQTILDLGAYQGYYSLYAYAQYPNAVIYAFEPLPKNFQALQRNMAGNQLDENRIKPCAAAVSDRVGTIPFYVTASAQMGNSAVYKGPDSITVPTLTIQEIMNRNRLEKIDILKIDIEGSEYGVFRGLPDAVLDRIDHIVAEMHSVEGENISDLVCRLEEKGLALKSQDDIGREFLFSRNR